MTKEDKQLLIQDLRARFKAQLEKNYTDNLERLGGRFQKVYGGIRLTGNLLVTNEN